MADQDVYGLAENGTYSTTGPAINLAGTLPSSPAIAQLFDNKLDSTDTATITIRKDQTNWAVYSGAVFTSGTPDSFALGAATLIDSEGTLSNSDSVEVLGLEPHSPAASDFECATFWDTTGGQVISAETTLNLDTTQYNSDATLFALATDQVTVSTAGRYFVSAGCTAELGSGTRTGFGLKLRVDSTDVDGAVGYAYARLAGEYAGTAAFSAVVNLSANDVLDLRVFQASTEEVDTVADSSWMTIVQLKSPAGPAGPQGETGAAGTSGTDGVTMSDYGEEAYNLGATLSGTVTPDLDDGMVMYGTATGTVTFDAVTNTTGHSATSWMLHLDTGGQTINWTFVDYWIGNTPSLTNDHYSFSFFLINGDWHGMSLGIRTAP